MKLALALSLLAVPLVVAQTVTLDDYAHTLADTLVWMWQGITASEFG